MLILFVLVVTYLIFKLIFFVVVVAARTHGGECLFLLVDVRLFVSCLCLAKFGKISEQVLLFVVEVTAVDFLLTLTVECGKSRPILWLPGKHKKRVIGGSPFLIV